METNETGQVKISDFVVATIASLAAGEIDGVSQLQGTLTGNISEMLGKKNFQKGVKVTMEEEGASIEVSLFVRYGVSIVDVANKVQENIKNAVETMAGIHVKKVDVTVEGITMDDPKGEKTPLEKP